MAGEEVEVAHMPHDCRWIEVFHASRWLATGRPSVELDAAARRQFLSNVSRMTAALRGESVFVCTRRALERPSIGPVLRLPGWGCGGAGAQVAR